MTLEQDNIPPMDALKTRTCSFWLDEYVRTAFHRGAEVGVEDARENLAATSRLTRGRAMPVLVDLRPVRSQSAEARSLFAGPEATAVSVAVALVIHSPVSRVIGNFFLGFNRPEVPTKLFTSVAEADEWLKTFLGHHGR